MSLPIHFRNTTLRTRRKYMETEERKLSRRFDKHTCTDGEDCPLFILEGVLREPIAEESFENLFWLRPPEGQ